MKKPSLFSRLSAVGKQISVFFLVSAVSITIFLSSFIAPADAHKVNIFAYAQDGKVYAEGYFVDGSKCKNSVIEVVDGKTGEKLHEGRTDDNGQMSFGIPRVTSLKLILRAGEGHRNEYVVSEEEIRQAMPIADGQTEKKGGKQVDKKNDASVERARSKDIQSGDVQEAMKSPVSPGEIEAVIGKVIDRRLQPVIKILLEMQEKSGRPSMTEILGGIGYIIGILGVIAYFKGRGASRGSRREDR